MTSHRGLVAFAVFLFGLSVAPANGQQTVTLGEGESVTVEVDPSYRDTIIVQDTLPAYQDTLAAYQDTLAAYQDTLAAYQDTLPAIQDTLPAVQDTIPLECALSGWTCIPPDVIPPVPTDSSTGPPLAVADVTLSLEGDTLVMAFPLRPQPDRAGNYTEGYLIGVGNNDTGNSVVLDSIVQTSPVRVVLQEFGNHYGCTEPFNNFGSEGLCSSIDYLAPVPPDTTPTPPVDPPQNVAGMTLTQVDSAIVVSWTAVPDADDYVVEGGQNFGSFRFDEEGVYTVTSVRLMPQLDGSHWVCVWARNEGGRSQDSRCQSIVFVMPIPPPVTSAYLLSISANRSEMTGMQDVVEGDYYIHLDRPDGAWLGQGDISMPGVDSVVYFLDGFRNREQVYPYEVAGGLIIGVPVGTHTVTWEVYGDQPDSGQASFNVTSSGTEPDPPTGNPDALGALFDLHRTGPFPARYVDLYDHWQPIHRARQEAQEANPNNDGGWALTYYDRGFGAYGMWYTGQGDQYLEAGDYSVLQYRDSYILPNDGGASPRWSFSEGLAAHALMTGDPESIRATFRLADNLAHWIDGKDSIPTTQYLDGRIQGRSILAQQMAYLVTGEQVYADRSQRGVDDLIRWYDAAGSNGRWDSEAFGATAETGNYCGGMATFQITHALLYAIIRHHQLVAPVPRLNEILTATLDRSATHWVPGQGFGYIQPPASFVGDGFVCEGSGSTAPGKDLTLLITTAYRYGYLFTSEPRFLAMAEEAEAFGLSGSVEFPTIFMSGDKQFNQSFFRTWRFITTSDQVGAATFHVPNPVPMQDPTVDTLSANMIQVLAYDVNPGDSLGVYTAMDGWSATLADVAGSPLPDSLGWYWLPAPDTGTIFLSNGTDTWQGTY